MDGSFVFLFFFPHYLQCDVLKSTVNETGTESKAVCVDGQNLVKILVSLELSHVVVVTFSHITTSNLCLFFWDFM